MEVTDDGTTVVMGMMTRMMMQTWIERKNIPSGEERDIKKKSNNIIPVIIISTAFQ